MAPGQAQSGIQRPVRRRRGRHLFRRQALQPDQDPRHYGRKVLEEFVKAGRWRRNHRQQAPHRHLPPGQHGRKMRATLTALGGEVPFRPGSRKSPSSAAPTAGARVRGGSGGGERLAAEHVVLAVGPAPAIPSRCSTTAASSSKPSPFFHRRAHRSIPRPSSTAPAFGPAAGHPLLGAADYKFVHHCANGRSAYSFCMCPGARWWPPRRRKAGW